MEDTRVTKGGDEKGWRPGDAYRPSGEARAAEDQRAAFAESGYGWHIWAAVLLMSVAFAAGYAAGIKQPKEMRGVSATDDISWGTATVEYLRDEPRAVRGADAIAHAAYCETVVRVVERGLHNIVEPKECRSWALKVLPIGRDGHVKRNGMECLATDLLDEDIKNPLTLLEVKRSQADEQKLGGCRQTKFGTPDQRECSQ